MFITLRTPVAAILISIPIVVLPVPRWLSLIAVNLMLAALVARDIVDAPEPYTLRPQLVTPPVTTLGSPSSGVVRVHNPARRTVVIGIHIESLPSMGLEPGRAVLSVDAGTWRTLDFTFVPSRRGSFVLGPLTLRSFGRLGLAGRQSRVSVTEPVKVYPALPGRQQVSLRLERARMLQAGERSTSIRGGGTSFDSLRDYHPDDEFRRINWNATARAAKPITNVFTVEKNQQVVLLLDAGRTMAASIQGITRFEYAIDASVAVADLAAHVGDHVGLVVFGRELIAMLPPRGGKAQSKRIVDTLFSVEPSLQASNYRSAFSALLSRYRRRALLLLITELMEYTSMESLFTSLPSILSRHLVMVGSVIDPTVESLSASLPTTSEEAYLKASASEAMMNRDLTASRLRSLGVTVIDRNPSELAGRLADEYLRIKAYGRL